MTRPALLFELTARCDRRCRHCYGVWQHDPSFRAVEPPWSELRRLLELALERLEPSSVTLLGGEPLLHERLFEVLELLARVGMPVAISTHGGHLGGAEARHMARLGVAAVEVSLGSDPGDGSTVASTCRALQALEQAGLRASASLALARPFFPAAMQWIARAVAAGAAAVVLQPLVEPVPGCLEAELVPTVDEHDALLTLLARWRDRTGFPVLLSGTAARCRVPAGATALLTAPCRCGRQKRCVDFLGRIRRCEVDPEVLGVLTSEAGAEPTAERQPSDACRPKRQLTNRCSSCADASACGGDCPRLVAMRGASAGRSDDEGGDDRAGREQHDRDGDHPADEAAALLGRG